MLLFLVISLLAAPSYLTFVNSDCPNSPEIENGKIIVHATRAGSFASVVCNKDHVFFGYSKDILCILDSTWSTPSGECKRIKWTNITSNTWLPVPKITDWTVLVEGQMERYHVWGVASQKDDFAFFYDYTGVFVSGDQVHTMRPLGLENWFTMKVLFRFEFEIHVNNTKLFQTNVSDLTAKSLFFIQVRMLKSIIFGDSIENIRK